ncbi:hypothetical protein COLO4_16499 [Corchorus olitorius]|uniref:RRM domain-containing protein n=1 Tax=Corchorus olitorius TaxID=93759 RepID=A0A1R3JH36_9ROSI|nr:hypothetical protein COLO4_16499 [Corchorus olitorius]
MVVRMTERWFSGQVREAFDWRSSLFSVFISNLSRRVSRLLLWDAFMDYGRVADVFIQRRSRQIGSTTFAFVRYWNEKDALLALENANQGYLEGVRIRTHEAIDTRRQGRGERGKAHMAVYKNIDRRNSTEAKIDGRSYIDVVKTGKDRSNQIEKDCSRDKGADNEQRRNSDLGVSMVVVDGEMGKHSLTKSISQAEVETLDLDVEITQEEMKWLENCVIGRLNQNIMFDQVKETVAVLNLDAVVIPLSNVIILLQFQNMEDAQSFIEHPGEFMDICCSKFHFWDDSGEETVNEVWLKLEGFPLFLWHQNFFKELTNRWGKFIKVAYITVERRTMVAAWILIEICDKITIPLVASGTWRRNKFSIKIVVDNGFSDDGISEDAGVKGFSVNELNDDCSCSGEKTLGTSPTLVNEDAINEVSEEVVLETVSRGEVVDSINNRMNVALEEELMCGGGYIAYNLEVSRDERINRDQERDSNFELGHEHAIVGLTQENGNSGSKELVCIGLHDVCLDGPIDSLESQPFTRGKSRNY